MIANSLLLSDFAAFRIQSRFGRDVGDTTFGEAHECVVSFVDVVGVHTTGGETVEAQVVGVGVHGGCDEVKVGVVNGGVIGAWEQGVEVGEKVGRDGVEVVDNQSSDGVPGVGESGPRSLADPPSGRAGRRSGV